MNATTTMVEWTRESFETVMNMFDRSRDATVVFDCNAMPNAQNNLTQWCNERNPDYCATVETNNQLKISRDIPQEAIKKECPIVLSEFISSLDKYFDKTTTITRDDLMIALENFTRK